ncbi:MAG: twin-arginine translocase subunit TatC, partial [Desulfobacterales bacterium]|nr:twin-arginine translocase subunit TatC [Desulfobacterales bacterium]
ELRDRLVRSFIAVGVGFVCAYFFKEQLFDILTAPLVTAMAKSGHAKLIFTGLPEAFFTYLKVALLGGIILATPVLFYEFWMFVSPGLYRDEKKYLLPIIFLSLIFFIAGSSFGYFIVFPYGFQFFLGFTTETIQAMPSMKEYLSFASKMLLAFGFVFELPLVLTFLSRMGLVTPAFLKKNRKYALLLFFVGAAIITPPDVVTQVMMAMPLILLYEVGIIGATIFSRKASVQEADDNFDGEEAQKEDDETSFFQDQESENDPKTENPIDPEAEEEKY